MPKYREKPIEAIQITEPTDVTTPGGPIHGKVGDFLVTGPAGQQKFVRSVQFMNKYELTTETDSATVASLRNKIATLQRALQELRERKQR